jgi:hypothetical protein
MKVLDIITESPKVDPRILDDDQIMEYLREAFKRNPEALQKLAANPEVEEKLGFFARNRANAAQAEAFLSKRWGTGLTTAFKTAQIIGPIVQWYVKMMGLNELAKEKQPNGEYKYTDAFLSQQRNEITGIMVISELLPAIGKSITAGLFVAFFKEVFKTGARNVAGKGGGWAVVIATLATTAGWAIFSNWLSTPAGTEWIKSFVPQLIINGIGALVNMPIDWLLDLLKKHVVDVRPDPAVRDRLDTTSDLNMPTIDPAKERARQRAADKALWDTTPYTSDQRFR